MMNVKPIQVLKDGVLIPLEHLPEADEFEIEQINGYVMVRPKTNGEKASEKPQKSWLHELIGIAETRDPTASSRVEEILAAEIDRHSGWTLKPPLDET